MRTHGCCRAEHVRWVSESLRPFSIVEDRGYQNMMKTGRPHHYVPTRAVLSRDVHMVFANVRKRVKGMLQVQ